MVLRQVILSGSGRSSDWCRPVNCREKCGACCIAPSINTPIPGMPDGKPAGVRCIHLDANNACELFGQAVRPQFCVDLMPEPAMCGDDRTQALHYLAVLEEITR